MILKETYDVLSEKYQGYSEADLELEEVSYWIRRLFAQALRDIRAVGMIQSGNQAAIEEMGLNVSFVQDRLWEYLKKEKESKDPAGTMLHEFLDKCAEKYKNQVAEFSGYIRFT